MAGPTYATDLTIYNDASSATGWDEISAYNAAGTPAADTDLAIHGSACISQDRAKVGRDNSIVYVGTSPTLPTDGVFLAWFKFFAPNSLDLLSNGGIAIHVGTDTTNVEGWWIGGSDTYPYGGWINYAIDPTIGSPDDTIGTVTNNALIGFTLDLVAAPSKGAPFTVDIIRWGRGTLEFTGGEVGTAASFAGFAAMNDTPSGTTGRLGLLQDVGGSYLYKGKMQIGLTGTACEFNDSSVVIAIDDTTHVSDTFNRIEINHVDTNVTWTGVQFTKLGTNALGDFEVVDDADVALTNCAFTNMNTFIFQLNSTIDSTTFRKCALVTQGTGTFTSCIFEESTASTALTSNDPEQVSFCSFVSTGTGHGMTITEAGTYAFASNKFTNYAATDGTTGNEAVFNDSGGLVTLNVSGSAGSFTVRNGTGASTTVNNTKRLTLTGLVAGTEVSVYETSASTELDHVESSGTTYTYDYNYTGDIGVFITVTKPGYKWIRYDNQVLDADGLDILVQQLSDPAYYNPS